MEFKIEIRKLKRMYSSFLCICAFYTMLFKLKQFKIIVYNDINFQARSIKFVSIIMPVFNKYHYLKRSIDSLKEQSLKNIEILIIDDCSSDNSSIYIKKQILTDPRIKLIQHIYNQGIASSRNHGILFSKGQYIMFLDPDDKFYKNSTELSYNNAVKLNADILEFEIFAFRRYVRNYTMDSCNQSTTTAANQLKLFQHFDYLLTNWNLVKRIVRNSIFQKAANLLTPFIENKRICVAEDFLLTSALYLFMKNYYCGHFLGYIYYRDLKDSSTNMRYISRYQTSIQSIFSDYLARYFYANRFNLSKCTLEHFLLNSSHSIIYNKVQNIDKKSVKHYPDNITGFVCIKYIEIGSIFIIKKQN